MTWNTGTSPSLGVLQDSVPDEFLLQEGRRRAGRRVSDIMDEVEDVSMELKRNPMERTC